MKIVLQKVASATVAIESEIVRSINHGYVLLLGIMHGDSSFHADLLIEKLIKIRLFTNAEGKMNDLTIEQVQGSLLVVSQFTLAGTVKKGNRPDYTKAESPELAHKLYTYFVQKLRESTNCVVKTGEFGATMQVSLVNDGPVTLILER